MSEESKMLSELVEATPTLRVLAPCIRPRSENAPKREGRKVSFPEEESMLVTGYLEPANPWEYAENICRDDLISTYKASCEKHGTFPIPQLIEQLQTLDIDADRNECLNLKGEILGSIHCETLEEVLKRIQFKVIDLEGTSLDDEGSVALFDMVEYYESATHLNISSNKNIGVRGWQACSRMIKKTRCLEQLEARSVTLNEQFMPILSRALRIGTQLQILKLENCNLSGRPTIILAAALKLNTGLRELYLADNNLGVTDAIQLGGLLRSNFTLQLLDISNNNIQDTGLGHISDGLMEQTSGQSGSGLSILVLWNNHLTRNASKHFARAVARSQSLETLNIGQNMLTNECLHVMKDSLQQNRTLLRLGMQSTHLSCEGAIALAECIADNPVIQRIDLRDNCLKVAGLMALALSMKVNTSVTQLDLDREPKKKEEKDNSLDQYCNLVSEIRGYCSRNETAAREEEDTVEEGPTTGTPTRGRLMSATSRKISLTCETLLRTTAMPPQPIVPDGGLLTEPRRSSSGRLRSPAPSPIPSPVSSPVPSPSRTRFQVSRVAESSPFLSAGQSGSPTSTSSSPITPPSLSSSPSRFFPSPSTSRFRVTLVEPSSSPTVTSPCGNITVGFNYKQNTTNLTKNENPIAAAATSFMQVVKKPAPEIVVTSTSTPQQTVTSQNVKVTVKLDSDSDNLIIENESIPSTASETSEDTADMEVQRIMDQGHLNNQKSWVSSSVQDSVTLLRRAGREVSVGPEKESTAHLPSSKPVEQSLVVQPTQVDSSISKDCTSDVKTDSSPSKSDSIESNAVQNILEERKEGTSENSVKQPEIIENSMKSAMTPQRTRKISWIAPVNPEPKSSLEKLLGLFHNPGSFFNKTHQQYKATAAIVNQWPVANSNASFHAGPLGSIANGDSGLMSSGSQDRSCSEAEQSKEPVMEANTSAKQSPIVLKKERQSTNCENPIPDIINNNNKLQDIVLGAGIRACSEQVADDGNKCISRRCEDENYNVPKPFEAVIETKVCDANGTKSSSQAVNIRSFHPPSEEGLKETSANKCDSKCNLSSKQGSEGSTVVEDINAGIKAMNLSDKPECLDDKSNASNSHAPVEKSWSQSCESSYVQGSATTVRLVGGASGFEFPPVDSEKEEASGLLLPELCGDSLAKPGTV